MPPERVLHTFSVRSLVPAPDISGARRGAEQRIHPAVQARLRRKYRTFQPEIVLSGDVVTSFGPVRVTGRLDGLRRTAEGIVLYEIKPVPGSAKRWAHHPSLQRARWQLQLYLDLARLSSPPYSDLAGGVLYLVDAGGKSAEEWVDLPPAGFLTQRLETVLSDARVSSRWNRISLDVLNEFVTIDLARDRPAQRTAWLQLVQHDPVVPALVSLPPGAGKTRLAMRYGLRHAVANRLPLFWITVKSRGKDEVLEELSRYSHAGLVMRVLWKTAAARLCDCDHAELCPKHERTLRYLFLHGLTFWLQSGAWTPDDVMAFAERHDLCGHELARHLEPLADVIIADLNYFLDESSLRERQAVTIFDEVQNLPERILQYSRVQLRRSELMAVLHSLPSSARQRYRALYSPEFLGDVESDTGPAQWSALASELPGNADEEIRHKIERISRLTTRYSGNFTLRWYHGPEGQGWVGTLLQPNVVLNELFSFAPFVLALSGSLSTAAPSPGFERFETIGAKTELKPPIAVVPLLEFSHPISLTDHEEATELLRAVFDNYGRTVAVFGQNRASNHILAMRLQVRGYTSLLDTDLRNNWEAIAGHQPDYLFVSLGGSLSEAVNPPPDLFSCGVVLAAGFRAPDIFDYLQQVAHPEPQEPASNVRATVSRVVQAAGRLQRSPYSLKPVLLVNKSFARPEFLSSFPREWYVRRPEELLFDNLKDAQNHLSRVRHAD